MAKNRPTRSISERRQVQLQHSLIAHNANEAQLISGSIAAVARSRDLLERTRHMPGMAPSAPAKPPAKL